jgi:hypothetical protein
MGIVGLLNCGLYKAVPKAWVYLSLGDVVEEGRSGDGGASEAGLGYRRMSPARTAKAALAQRSRARSFIKSTPPAVARLC